ncbi:hypothetical protein ACEN8K_41445 [Variovorax sp. CT11-76]
MPALTAALRARPFAAERRSTRFVVLQHGINDAQNATALAPPLRRMVERVQAEGRVPIVTGLARGGVVGIAARCSPTGGRSRPIRPTSRPTACIRARPTPRG